jgi:WD40 repeat protein
VGKISTDTGLKAIIRLWDMESGETRDLDCGHKGTMNGVGFLPENRLISTSDEGLRLWDLESGEHEILSSRKHLWFEHHPSGRFLLCDTPLGATLWDLEERIERLLPVSNDDLASFAISPNAQFMVIGMVDGDVLYWPLDSDEPHLLIGHEEWVTSVKVSPDSNFIMAIAQDGMMRTWPVPKGPPLHTRALDELLDILYAQTNMRVIVDEESPDGYRVEYEVFDCWDSPPNW